MRFKPKENLYEKKKRFVPGVHFFFEIEIDIYSFKEKETEKENFLLMCSWELEPINLDKLRG